MLGVGNDVPGPLRRTVSDFARLLRRSVRARDHDAKAAEFEGVLYAGRATGQVDLARRPGVSDGPRLPLAGGAR